MKGLIAIFIALAVIIFGLSSYLAPDGLSDCDSQPTEQGDCKKVDAIVAVSGGDTQARTRMAIQLYKNGWADKLVFSGAALDKTGPSNAEAMRRQAIAADIPDHVIIIEETAETTKQNAENAKDVFDKNGIQSVILVTSAYHQRRAGLEFAKRASNEIKIVNHPVKSDNQWSDLWWLTPGGWWLASSEFFKIIVFYMGGTR
ncbi:TPA: YdcF family protein [Candidatus Saccharibacteria bacterium]|nr:MAG: exported protein of unknown function [Candidatus Saccharibacteria bacterium GW2011_GWC2_44_17]MBH1956015.1 YdcF family protein [Candidatus Saccharibacteria bacterium]OGL23682.1 MAG: hypothetical protein A2791_02495 [Candidatus Saccharibacteria bacterium RIFCSPHIGHO2_01_FULL_46_30]OGL33316.1 MAG: hypothetical protein A3E20_00100 [Candidatus Saccharibacteria bacterium RIFCSPHIGHO2_12_FULL_47_16]MBH1972403.1 YdcF family protein [Candidatus Saccharibacteria bacterium]